MGGPQGLFCPVPAATFLALACCKNMRARTTLGRGCPNTRRRRRECETVVRDQFNSGTGENVIRLCSATTERQLTDAAVFHELRLLVLLHWFTSFHELFLTNIVAPRCRTTCWVNSPRAVRTARRT